MNQSPDFIENKLAPTFIEHPSDFHIFAIFEFNSSRSLREYSKFQNFDFFIFILKLVNPTLYFLRYHLAAKVQLTIEYRKKSEKNR
ncbi:hypothetical protein BpHYR1_047662 [Brachionus plicatilis]|uniref:Uncharacterized protein n=1 Tax=Brachionus plicatilis TaxID=10195 RepID=A0A3M7S1P9_BRAPC|nr:hypothetical protein BpHYR1_047662 [Brachionus plicatilis]